MLKVLFKSVRRSLNFLKKAEKLIRIQRLKCKLKGKTELVMDELINPCENSLKEATRNPKLKEKKNHHTSQIVTGRPDQRVFGLLLSVCQGKQNSNRPGLHLHQAEHLIISFTAIFS